MNRVGPIGGMGGGLLGICMVALWFSVWLLQFYMVHCLETRRLILLYKKRLTGGRPRAHYHGRMWGVSLTGYMVATLVSTCLVSNCSDGNGNGHMFGSWTMGGSLPGLIPNRTLVRRFIEHRCWLI
jgi:hypothetical protein